jgi:hypothetical protein
VRVGCEALAELGPLVPPLEGGAEYPPPARDEPVADRLASQGGKVGVVLGRGGMTRGLPGVDAVVDATLRAFDDPGFPPEVPFDIRRDRSCEESPKRTVRVSVSKSKDSARKSSSVFSPMVIH